MLASGAIISKVSPMFEVTDKSTKARAGELKTAHGTIQTPAFMPVGTQGSVKTVSAGELRQLKTQIVLGNAYHLFVRPGLDVIRAFGGLHAFMSWRGPILTDSGGYQIFSLAKLRKITEEGVHFQNHVDGTPAFVTPEIAMEIQEALGSDIAMVLDECPPWPCEYDYAARSMELTARWARRCKQWWRENSERRTSNGEAVEAGASPANRKNAADPAATTETEHRMLVFGIVQGATFPELRKQSALAAVDTGFDGYAVGGVSVGEPEAEMMDAVEASAPFLPENKPRYAMGLGTPPQLLELIARGMDLFDCVLPTRLARNGTAFTASGTLNLKNAEFAQDKDPIEPGCTCPACREYARGYVRHLIKAEEILGLRLITLHNLHFYLDLMRQARTTIVEGRFDEFRSGFVSAYKTRNSDLPGQRAV